MLIKIRVYVVPRGKERPRHSRFGAQNTYTPKATEDYETSVKLAGVATMQGRPPFEQFPRGISMLVSGFLAIPVSWPLAKRSDALHHRIRPTCKPDWDNVGKATDALRGVVFQDDAHVTDGRVVKWYTDSLPSVLIEVWPTQAGLAP